MGEAAGLFYEVEISEAEARVCRPPFDGTVSEWAEAHVVLPPGKNARPGQLRLEITPYLVDILDTMGQPWVREGVICAAQQLGKTLAAHVLIGYWADTDPGSALVVMPDELMAQRIVNEKLRPMWQASPALAALAPGPDDLKTREFHLMNGMDVYLAWARSASAMSSLTFRYVILDEVDKYPPHAGARETDPIYLAEARTRTFRGQEKVLKVSTPTWSGGNIWQALLGCDEIRQRYVRCPACGVLQKARFSGVRWPAGERDPRRVLREKLAWYECEACRARWDDAMRDEAVRAGQWRRVWPEELSLDPKVRAAAEARPRPEPVERPASVGWQIPAILSHFVPLPEVAAKFLATLRAANTKAALQDFHNHYLGEPFDEHVKAEAPAEESLLRFRWDLPPGVAPEWTTAVVLAVDMQKVGFWFSVWAFERALSGRRAMIQHGYLPDWDDVRALAFESRFRVDGREGLELPVWRGALDTGGGKGGEDWSRTEEAYNWLRVHGRGVMFGVKGQPRRPNVPKVRPSVQDKMPGAKGRVIPGGLVIWLIDSARFKDDIFAAFADRVGCPHPECGVEASRFEVIERNGLCPECGRMLHGWEQRVFLHSETDVTWARQMLAEEKHRQKNGTYEWVQVRKDNHYLDCTVYAWACAAPEWAGGTSVLAEPGTHTQAPPKKPNPLYRRPKLW